jgi:hypothetical protein
VEISKIEVSFARPVDLTDSEMHAIHNIVDDAALLFWAIWWLDCSELSFSI